MVILDGLMTRQNINVIHRKICSLCTFGLLSTFLVVGCQPSTQPMPNAGNSLGEVDENWQSLFNRRDLSGWRATNFGGEGEIKIENGEMHFELGYPMTGVTWAIEDQPETSLPTTNYEISLEAQRVHGNDFFCGLTFPVDDSHCSLIVGGWGGTLVGLSSIDGKDAANNDTAFHQNFKTGQWYQIRIRVTPGRIRAAIDNEWLIDRDISKSQVTVRAETLLSRPLGICSFETEAAFKNIKIRELR